MSMEGGRGRGEAARPGSSLGGSRCGTGTLAPRVDGRRRPRGSLPGSGRVVRLVTRDGDGAVWPYKRDVDRR